ncbi:MAG: metal ABC transporter permease [Verrucomicrobiales bacterium]|nr:metal ABC transporter permease [Verrucomicrobiales bacterium]
MASIVLLAALLWLAGGEVAQAARIGDLGEVSAWQQALRFFSFRDAGLRLVLVGCLLLGLNCGLLGGFVVVRRMALVGDTLSHAVLPGIALGFLWNMDKDPVAIMVGATVFGLFGVTVVGWITRTTLLKQDAALGLVLSSFYALGICLVTMIQRLPTGNKSGIDKFMFGQAAALGENDIILMLITTVVTLVVVVVCYRGLLVLSFDREFGQTTGLPMHALHHVVMLLTAFAIVVAMQAVGVVLVSSMLIIPAASAYLLTDRLHRLLIYAAVIGMGTAVLGAFFSFLGNNLPTGPFMVLAGTGVFVICFLFSPRYGWWTRLWRLRSRRLRTEREDTLKAMYRVLENREFHGEGVSAVDVAEYRKDTVEEIQRRVQNLVKTGLATDSEEGQMIHFTPKGYQQACMIVRNHRLWELYLTNVARYAADHVHEDAELVEHVLGEDTVRRLERRLKFPNKDPHGKPIPSVRDMLGMTHEEEGAKMEGGYGYRP